MDTRERRVARASLRGADRPGPGGVGVGRSGSVTRADGDRLFVMAHERGGLFDVRPFVVMGALALVPRKRRGLHQASGRVDNSGPLLKRAHASRLRESAGSHIYKSPPVHDLEGRSTVMRSEPTG